MIEKFTTKFQIEAKVQAIKFANECYKVADEYAIGFAEWVLNNCDEFPAADQELILKVYKKEKGL